MFALIVAGEEDTYSAQSSQKLEQLSAGEAKLRLYTGASHGTDLLTSQPELAGEIIAWLDSHMD